MSKAGVSVIPKEAPAVIEPVTLTPETKTKAVQKNSTEIAVDAIALYRRQQVENALYTISGNEIMATVGGSVVAKAFAGIDVEKARDETHTAFLNRRIERNKSLLASVLQGYAAFGASKIFSIFEKNDFVFVVSTDGRKYKVNLKTAQVE